MHQIDQAETAQPNQRPEPQQFTITKYKHSRFWAVQDASGELICLCVYKRGANEIVRRLSTSEAK